MNTGKLQYPSLITVPAAFLFLSALLNFNYPDNHYLYWHLLQPSLDVWLLLILLAITACLGKRLLFWTTLLTCAVFLVLRVIRIGDTVVPMYLNRPFNLYIDSNYLFGLYDLLKTSSRQAEFLVLSVSVTILVPGIIISSWYAWQTAARGLLDRQARFSLFVISGLILCTALFRGWRPTHPPALLRLGQEILSISQQLDRQQALVNRMEKTARERATGPRAFQGLEGADVLLFMVESYGRVVFSQNQYRQTMEASITDFAKTLQQHGFVAVSSYLDSPTYGGSSWLAHGTLEFGIRVENDLDYTALLRSSLSPLASFFRKSGYHTISVMPGTRLPFPEGASYDYDQVYYSWHFGYHGPTFGWAPMPDQFVLDRVHRQEFLERRQPLFVRYILVSSHAAFNIQPHFIDDWSIIGDGSIYNEREPVYYPIYWPNLENAGDAYLRSLHYEFTTLGDYLAKFVSGDTLVIIMGDHQPNLQLTGPDEPWSVPVHIISRNPSLLIPFQNRGYTPGLIPDQPLPHAGMKTFFQDFLQDFGE
ncbi:MAG: sulfatase-like hydrolase/transferase [Desulforhopalus sp.]